MSCCRVVIVLVNVQSLGLVQLLFQDFVMSSLNGNCCATLLHAVMQFVYCMIKLLKFSSHYIAKEFILQNSSCTGIQGVVSNLYITQ